ncbi:BPSS1780 family membrane protein [Photorhabdus heterorhabditis]|nr:BPSS1780 family membrane protein [Photorhabdus heterorhabditis]
MWILLCIIYLIFVAGFQFIPFLGVFVRIFNSVFIGGIIAACEQQRTTGKFELGLFFSGFQKNFASLLGVGALSFGITFLGIIAMFIIDGEAITDILFAILFNRDVSFKIIEYSSPTLFFSVFALMISYIIATALTWFAPALIVIHNLKLGAAISMSLKAVKKNLLPGLLFFIISTVIIIISVLTFGLGFLISMPILLASYYSSYRSIFISKEKPSSLIA